MTKPSREETSLVKRRDLKNGYFSIVLGPYSRARRCRPGQFVHIRFPGCEVLFRRAFSIASIDLEGETIELIFKVLGKGTSVMSRLHRDDRIDVLGPLGVPFRLPQRRERAILVAGGVGFPPLLFLAEEMIRRGHRADRIEFFYGGREACDILERKRLKGLGVNLHPCTEDGSLGERGLVTQPVEEFIVRHASEKVRLYVCGPEGMLKATNDLGLRLHVEGQLSLEAPMPCGIGICLGCVVPLTRGGHARVCREGPVFEIGEVAL
jgi:dihydroorotate dehydrogenase electron transfer subunit